METQIFIASSLACGVFFLLMSRLLIRASQRQHTRTTQKSMRKKQRKMRENRKKIGGRQDRTTCTESQGALHERSHRPKSDARSKLSKRGTNASYKHPYINMCKLFKMNWTPHAPSNERTRQSTQKQGKHGTQSIKQKTERDYGMQSAFNHSIFRDTL